jgi:hypothetical protein
VIRAVRVNKEFQRLEQLKRARDRAATIDDASKNLTGPAAVAAVGQEKEVKPIVAETNVAAGDTSSTNSPSLNGLAAVTCP